MHGLEHVAAVADVALPAFRRWDGAGLGPVEVDDD
jgi:hypothetical protein